MSQEELTLQIVERGLPAELLNKFDAFLIKMPDVIKEAEYALASADQLVIDSEASFQLADRLMTGNKQDAKAVDDERLGLTRSIDDFKQQFVDAARPAKDKYTEAASILQAKMSKYLREQREEAARKQREAERIQAEVIRRQEEEARKLREKAAKLKTEEARARALAEAEAIQMVADMTPTSVPIAPAPVTVASNVAEVWEIKERKDVSAYLRWLADHPEWQCVVGFKTAEENRLAKQYRNVVPVPGLVIGTKDSFRTKPRG